MKKKLSKTLNLYSFRKLLKYPKAVLFLFLAVIFQNCQAPIEGCLDVRATNFDVTASKACNKNCTCTYPSLVVSANYLNGTADLFFDSTYTNDVGEKYRIVSSQMYISGFQVINAKNEVAKPLDSISLTRATDTVTVLNNYALVGKALGFSFTIGTFNNVGAYTKVKFRLGLDDIAAKTVPSKMPTTHPLSTQTDSMYITSQSQYIFNKMVIAKGTNFLDTLRINVTTPTDFELGGTLTFTEGFNAKVPLAINYANFFSGVTFSATQDVIQNKIISNTKNVFSIQ